MNLKHIVSLYLAILLSVESFALDINGEWVEPCTEIRIDSSFKTEILGARTIDYFPEDESFVMTIQVVEPLGGCNKVMYESEIYGNYNIGIYEAVHDGRLIHMYFNYRYITAKSELGVEYLNSFSVCNNKNWKIGERVFCEDHITWNVDYIKMTTKKNKKAIVFGRQVEDSVIYDHEFHYRVENRTGHEIGRK